MSGAPLTRTATLAAPVLWPGMSKARPLEARDPSPGKTDIDAGAPPAGLTIVCGGPVSRTVVCVVPPSPGYAAAVATPSTSALLDGSKPRSRLTAKPGCPVLRPAEFRPAEFRPAVP